MRRLVVGQSFAKRRILACESILIATQLYTSGTAATPTKAEENVDGSRLCRPPSVPTLLLCTKREQNSEPPKLTNAFILEFLRSRLSPLQTVGTGGNDESKSLIAKSKSVVAKVEKGMKASASFVNKSKSTSSIYGSGEMLSLDCRADLAAWSLVHDKEGDDDQRSSIPRVEYSSASHTYLVKSGGIHLGSVGLEGVHAALEKKINAMISHSNAERRNSTTKSADVGSHCSVPFVIGTDEAGRGPLAGPVVCAAYSRLLVKESPRYREDKIVEGVKSPSLSPTKVFLEPVTVRDYTCIDGEEERGARNGGSGCVHFPFSSLPTTSLRGGHFPSEVVPAMDSKQFPTGERRYAFKALVTGESVSSECGSPVSEPPQIITSSSSSSTLSFSSGESFLRSLESLIGGEIDFEKVVPEKNLLPAESVSFHTITNPLPVELALSISGGSDSNSQRLVPLVGEDYEKLMRRVCIDSDHEHNNVKSNLRGQPQSRKFICLERLLRAAGEKDHPPLITTIAFRSIVKVPRPQSSSSSSLSSSPSSVTVHSEHKGKIENNGPLHASSTAAEVPLTIGNVRAALKAFDEAVKIGSKALTSAEKKAAKAAAKAQRETDKKAVKLMKAESKKEARAAAHSKDECVGDACEVGEEQEQGILVQKELSSLPPPLDWQPDGLHASLKAIWDAHEQLYGKQKPIGAERDTNATEGETERENISNHYYYIQHGAVSIVNHVFIDATNILAASMHGMTAAVRAVNASVIETQASLEVAGKSSKTISSLSSSSHDGVRTHNLPAVVLVDGSQAPGDLVRLTTDAKEGSKGLVEGDAHPRVGAVIPITKGDSTSYSIAAASLLAKSTRDAIMGFYGSSRMYPEYGLADHEGYPCPSHRNAIIQHGLSPIHRKTFGPCRAVMLSKKNA